MPAPLLKAGHRVSLLAKPTSRRLYRGGAHVTIPNLDPVRFIATLERILHGDREPVYYWTVRFTDALWTYYNSTTKKAPYGHYVANSGSAYIDAAITAYLKHLEDGGYAGDN